MLPSLLAFFVAFSSTTSAQDPETRPKDPNGHFVPSYSPGRAPALPLAVRSPYTNAWVSTVNNGTLNSNGAIMWTGSPLGWEGIITVDGVSYEYFGTGMSALPVLKDVKKAVPQTVSYDSQYSNFSLDAGPVRIHASFFSPVLPKDYCRTSFPLSYFEASFQSTDGASHDVQLYSDVNGAWISNEGGKGLNWTLYRGSTIINNTQDNTGYTDTVYKWVVNQSRPILFAESSDHPQWGSLIYASRPGGAKDFTYESGHSTDMRYKYIFNSTLTNLVDAKYRSRDDREPVFAFSHDFGDSSSGSVLYTVGTAQSPMMRYISSKGVSSLEPWWRQCYGDMLSMIDRHYADYATAQTLAAQFEQQLKADIGAFYQEDPGSLYPNKTPNAASPYGNSTRMPIYLNSSQVVNINSTANGTDQFGHDYIFDPATAYGYLTEDGVRGIAIPDIDEATSYYAIVALSTRQVMGAYALATLPSDTSKPLVFQKEISSDGNVNTVDVVFPAMPFFLYANPEFLKFNLDPLFENQEGGFYPNSYSMHDMGSNFPNATGHVEGNDEYMPVEESGNMIIMTYAYYKFTGDASHINQHYSILKAWAQYLIEFALVPGNQLSTDDFAGRLTNQTNLAIKGIVALQAMSKIATIASQPSDASKYAKTAADFYQQWTYFAIDPSNEHTLLAYQHRSSWGLLYNTYPDKLLDLGVVSGEVYEMQSDWYAKVSQIYGVPLDSRHHYTKSDWELWAAATCTPSTRRLFVNAIAYWLNNTKTDRAFADLYETIDQGNYPSTPDSIHFIARPVAGGHFSLLALLKAGMNKNSLFNGTMAGNGTNLGWNATVPWRTASLTAMPAATESYEAHTGQTVAATVTTAARM